MVHTWKETGKVVHSKKRTATSFKTRLTKTGIKHSDLYGEGLHETHLAYNWRYGYCIPYYGKDGELWKRGFNTDWITGTCDYSESLDYGRSSNLKGIDPVPPGLWVDDLKTGKWWTKTPRQSAQIAFYAMCMRHLYDSHVNVSVTHWPRYPASGRPTRTVETIERDELDRFEEKVQRAAYAAISYEPAFNPTEDGCRFCPARKVCINAFNYDEVS